MSLALFAVGWLCGWLLLWRPRRLPTGPHDHRPPVQVVIPARDEAHALGSVLTPLVRQQRDGDRIVVVDDHSSDGTGDVARSFDITVTTPAELPDGWLGKPHACWHGATADDGSPDDVLVFLDADVRPGPTLLDDLAAEVAGHPDDVVSVQPWHEMATLAEQPSTLCNITALMGCGAFTPSRRTGTTVAFGPVIAVRRDTYLASGGHAERTVRQMHTEDIGLARAVGSSRLYVGDRLGTTFRMYPSGLRELTRGWTRSLATGARFTPVWLAILTAAWVWSVAGGWLAEPFVYPLTALQVWVLGRRAGNVHPLAALLFPLLVIVFVVIFLRSLVAVVFKRDVTWKGRQVGARPG